MIVHRLHGWQVTPEQAQEIQRRLAGQVSQRNGVSSVRLIAGVDISSGGKSGIARGAVVVLRYPELTLVEKQVIEEKLPFPYIPGLLSFRESPLILAACAKLSNDPDLILVDGQGYAHPRRLGLASHLGILLDTPTIGCAKSRLCGKHNLVGAESGDYAELLDNEEVIGAALRTNLGSAPLYISVGHRIDLTTSLQWVLNCCRGNRLPEPTRLAHLAAGGQLEKDASRVVAGGQQERLFHRAASLTK